MREQHSATGAGLRQKALLALLAVERGELGSQAAVSQALQGVEGADRALMTELIYGCLRRQRSLDTFVAAACARGLGGMPPVVLTALRLGAFQLLELTRVPPFAAVSATVEACKGLPGGNKGTVGFVHAVLRTLARQLAAGAKAESADLPPWIAARIVDFAADLGVDAAALGQAFTEQAPLHLQVLGVGEQLDETTEVLLRDGVLGSPLPVPGAWLAAGPRALQHPLFGKRFLAQDAASAAVVRWLNPQAGAQVLDLAAGRGVKAAQLAGCGAQVTAVDVAVDKLAQAQALCAASGAPLVAVLAADATDTLPFEAGTFDAVLVDAPCSGLGTLRRRPEIRHRRRAADLFALATIQRQLARQAVRLVKPGGTIMLASCSFAREEGPLWLSDLLRYEPGVAVNLDVPPWVEALGARHGVLRTTPLHAGMDAFFCVRLLRHG